MLYDYVNLFRVKKAALATQSKGSLSLGTRSGKSYLKNYNKVLGNLSNITKELDE